jgi:hemolysin activation/secretion protein
MGGVRAGVYRTQQFCGGAYAVYRTDYRDVAVGADGFWDHWPVAHTQLGFNVERSLTSLDDGHFNDRGVVYGRYVFQYGDSLYLPPMQYVEMFGAIENNRLPIPRYDEPGSQRFDHMSLVGVHYHQDYLTPYWNPEGGFRLDATYAAGIPIFGEDKSFQQLSGQFSYVQCLPDCLGWLSETRLATRVYGAVGLPTNGLYFPLGGAGLFRGFDQAERQGSLVWVGSAEWRVPLVRGLRWDCVDHTVGLREVWGVTFYDVGNAYVNGHAVGDVAHAIGAGVAFDVAWFSFVERTMIRLDVAQTINSSAPLQFNFYFQHPF